MRMKSFSRSKIDGFLSLVLDATGVGKRFPLDSKIGAQDGVFSSLCPLDFEFWKKILAMWFGMSKSNFGPTWAQGLPVDNIREV